LQPVKRGGIPRDIHWLTGECEVFAERRAHKGAATLLPDLPAAKEMLGDKGYDSDAYRAALIKRGKTPRIPPRSKRKHPATYCKTLNKQRHKVENMFAELKDWRRIAMRFDRCAHAFISAIQIAAIASFWI